MNECVEFYQKQAQACRLDLPWAALVQEKAQSNFVRDGFPTRHDEDWKYTSVERFLKHRFVQHQLFNESAAALLDLPVDCYPFSIINGFLQPTQETLPPGVVIIPLLTALETMPEIVTPHLGKVLQSEHAFQSLNTAMLKHGLLIYVPDNVCLDKPLWINHWQDSVNQAVYLRHLLIMGKGSQVSVIEDYRGDENACYFTNTMSEIYLDKTARLTHYKIQRESKQAFHVGHLAVKQMAHSQFDSHSFSMGGAWVRSDMTVNFDEPHAQCLMNGVYLPDNDSHIDHHTLVQHAVPECQSVQDYKGIMQGHSRAVFNGRVVVAQDAQHTRAEQHNKNLLLSAHAEIDTKPQLEIFADDVVCTHGATVGSLDEDALFYLATRGIDREEASQYLLRAFMLENLKLIENEKLKAWIGQLINVQLGCGYE